jgi:hypothetical protein
MGKADQRYRIFLNRQLAPGILIPIVSKIKGVMKIRQQVILPRMYKNYYPPFGVSPDCFIQIRNSLLNITASFIPRAIAQASAAPGEEWIEQKPVPGK